MDTLLAMVRFTHSLCCCRLQTLDCCGASLPVAQEQLTRIMITRQIFKNIDFFLPFHSLHINEAFGNADIISRRKKKNLSLQNNHSRSLLCLPMTRIAFRLCLMTEQPHEQCNRQESSVEITSTASPHISILHIRPLWAFVLFPALQRICLATHSPSQPPSGKPVGSKGRRWIWLSLTRKNHCQNETRG